MLTVGCNMKSDTQIFGHLPKAELDAIKIRLDELHKRKIDLADEVLILNVGGYIGDSTRSEWRYAKDHNKVIRWLEEGNLTSTPPPEPAAPANLEGLLKLVTCAETADCPFAVSRGKYTFTPDCGSCQRIAQAQLDADKAVVSHALPLYKKQVEAELRAEYQKHYTDWEQAAKKAEKLIAEQVEEETLKKVGKWLALNNRLFIGNFQGGDNFGELLDQLEQGQMPDGEGK